MSNLIIALLFIMLSVSPLYADIYKYTDENGIVCYTDTPLDKNAHIIQKDKKDLPATVQQAARKETVTSADYHSIIQEKASIYDLDPSLIKAVITTESNWDCTAISRKGAIGLMQLMPSTATDMNVRNPFDPEENIEGGTRYLSYLLQRFHGNLTLALAAYNAGPNAVERFGKVPPFSETKHYVNKVLSLYKGNSAFGSGSASGRKADYPDSIYKITLKDGTVLFTNSSFHEKNNVRF